MMPRLSILIYHRVLAVADPLLPDVPDVRLFVRQMGALKRYFQVLPLDRAVRQLQQGTLPPRAACITFDDGYADNAEHALPVLRTLGLPACFFIATGFLDGGRMWNDHVIEYVRRLPAGELDLSLLGCGPLPGHTIAQKVAAIGALLARLKYLPPLVRDQLTARLQASGGPELMLNRHSLLALHHAGMQLGAHTERHPILTQLADHAAMAEMAASKRKLEQLTSAPITLFAYPNGKLGQDFEPRHARMAAAAGFEAAVTTHAGVSSQHSDYFQLPRFTPWEHDRPRFLLRLMQNHYRRPA